MRWLPKFRFCKGRYLAVLCIGYADGLADAVRIAHGLEPAGASDKSII